MNAMEPFSTPFNVAVLRIAKALMPNGFDCSAVAPATFEEACTYYYRTGRVLVSNAHSANTIYGDPEINLAFRAWHDFAHINGQYDFTLEGERATCAAQKRLAFSYGRNAFERTEFSELIHAEVTGQAECYEAHKAFPVNQRGFVLAYIQDAGKALAGVW